MGNAEYWSGLDTKFLLECDPRPSTSCGRVECGPGWDWEFRQHDYDLWYVVSGTGRISINQVEYSVAPECLYFLRRGDAGWAVQDPDDRLTVIFLHFDFFAPGGSKRVSPAEGWLPSREIPFRDGAVLKRLLTRAVRAMHRRRSLDLFEARSMLHLALLEIYRQDALNKGKFEFTLDPRIEELTSYLRDHPSTRMMVSEAAQRVGLSPDYFSRLFKQQVGESFRSYLLRVRLEHARLLLEDSSMRIGEIADSLGYQDVYLFSRQFRKLFNRPPSEVRKRG